MVWTVALDENPQNSELNDELTVNVNSNVNNNEANTDGPSNAIPAESEGLTANKKIIKSM